MAVSQMENATLFAVSPFQRRHGSHGRENGEKRNGELYLSAPELTGRVAV